MNASPIKHVKITVETPPDGWGRQTFCADWVCQSRHTPRGQYFRAVVAEHVQHWERDGWIVEVAMTY
jgi:hypothetical protein